VKIFSLRDHWWILGPAFFNWVQYVLLKVSKLSDDLFLRVFSDEDVETWLLLKVGPLWPLVSSPFGELTLKLDHCIIFIVKLMHSSAEFRRCELPLLHPCEPLLPIISLKKLDYYVLSLLVVIVWYVIELEVTWVVEEDWDVLDLAVLIHLRVRKQACWLALDPGLFLQLLVPCLSLLNLIKQGKIPSTLTSLGNNSFSCPTTRLWVTILIILLLFLVIFHHLLVLRFKLLLIAARTTFWRDQI
jgi:hypothetical protein